MHSTIRHSTLVSAWAMCSSIVVAVFILFRSYFHALWTCKKSHKNYVKGTRLPEFVVLGRSLVILSLYVNLKVSLTIGDPERIISSDCYHFIMREVPLQCPGLFQCHPWGTHYVTYHWTCSHSHSHCGILAKAILTLDPTWRSHQYAHSLQYVATHGVGEGREEEHNVPA